jgi:hypothetical protein
VDLCATVFYKKWIRGRLYPKAARTGPYAFAQEVSRVNGRVVTRYLGIVQVPGRVAVVEMRGESNEGESREPESVQQKLQ